MTTRRNDTLVPTVLAPMMDGQPRTVKQIVADTGLTSGKVYGVVWKGSPWVQEVKGEAAQGRWWVLTEAGRQIVEAHTAAPAAAPPLLSGEAPTHGLHVPPTPQEQTRG